MTITEDLKLDMMWVENEFLDIAITVAETSDCLLRSGVKHRLKFTLVHGRPHSPTASTCSGLDHHGIADFCGDFEPFFDSGKNSIRSGRRRNPIGRSSGSGRVFVTHGADHLSRGSDKLDIAALADLSKAGIFG